MSVYRRGDTWWYEFLFAGTRIRESAKSASKSLAKEAEKKRRRELEQGFNGLATEDRSHRVLTFAQASESFLAEYSLRHRPNSVIYMTYCVKHLSRHLGDMMLVEIGIGTVRSYQTLRIGEQASPKCINEEVMVLLQIMREMGDLIRVKMKRDKTLKLSYQEYEGKALSADEVSALYNAAGVEAPAPGEKHDLKATRTPMILPAIALGVCPRNS